jgi:branched-chain amino acid transport system substrate-binding protein
MQRRTLVALATLAATLSAPVFSQSGEIRIAHVYSKTGLLEAYGK